MNIKSISRHVIKNSLKYWRNKSGYTHKQVADYIGINMPAYQAYEEGRSEPRAWILKKLANLYKLQSIEDMIDFDLIINS